MINMKKERNGMKNDPSFAKEYRKEIIRKMVQKGISHHVEEEWHTIKESIIERTEEMIGEMENREMENGIMMNIAKL